MNILRYRITGIEKKLAQGKQSKGEEEGVRYEIREAARSCMDLEPRLNFILNETGSHWVASEPRREWTSCLFGKDHSLVVQRKGLEEDTGGRRGDEQPSETGGGVLVAEVGSPEWCCQHDLLTDSPQGSGKRQGSGLSVGPNESTAAIR